MMAWIALMFRHRVGDGLRRLCHRHFIAGGGRLRGRFFVLHQQGGGLGANLLSGRTAGWARLGQPCAFFAPPPTVRPRPPLRFDPSVAASAPVLPWIDRPEVAGFRSDFGHDRPRCKRPGRSSWSMNATSATAAALPTHRTARPVRQRRRPRRQHPAHDRHPECRLHRSPRPTSPRRRARRIRHWANPRPGADCQLPNP